MEATKKALEMNPGPRSQSLNNANYNPMLDKCNAFQETAQLLLQGRHELTANIAFFGNHLTKKVKWTENGRTRNFGELSPTVFTLLANAYSTNSEAKFALEGLLDHTGKLMTFTRKVELYTYYSCRNLNLQKPVIPFTRRIANFFAA